MTTATTISPSNHLAFCSLRRTGFGLVSQARASRAKTKTGKDAGRVNGIAIGSTEDAARRRFAAASGEPESTKRIRVGSQKQGGGK
jgi:hypothetical protein